MQVEVKATHVDERKADDRGRVTLGAEYAGKVVTVAILDVEDDDAETDAQAES